MKPDGYVLKHNLDEHFPYIYFWNNNSFSHCEFYEALVFATKKEAVQKSEFIKKNSTPSYMKNLKITIQPIKYKYEKVITGKVLV